MIVVHRHDHRVGLRGLRIPVLWHVTPALDPHCNDGNQHEQHAQEEHHRINTGWLLGFSFSRG